jgi:hypothetical protein
MKLLKLILSAIIGLASVFIFRSVLFLMLVPDSCVYHNGKEEGFIIKTFYEMNSGNGFHPEPNSMNNYLTLLLGGGIGISLYFIFNKFPVQNKEL